MKHSVDFSNPDVQQQIGICAVDAALRMMQLGGKDQGLGFKRLQRFPIEKMKAEILKAAKENNPSIVLFSGKEWFWPTVISIIEKGPPLPPPALLK
ncbi:hypothetical protein [Glaciimonas sp. PCH181]|uniref:hypothetical protein n=1 Tax=Glaciimonas sp. PCH181 TaxID=2133943 RepID=UPI000D3B4636|nr:hypothetical protein [Glaciimonas sp. PCH181]PUA17327.1 hypothetical protein C7W93_15490 [Glaciimonas sp. PCH181]